MVSMIDFNWKIYLKNYPDIKEHNIDTEEKAYKHYLEHGIYEDRVYYDLEEIKYFDWITYLNNYPDLKEYCIDTEEKAKDHYLNKGMKEDRIFYNINDIIFDDFDWQKYILHYNDLHNLNLNNNETILHWLKYGQKENRIFFKYSDKILPNYFNWIEYINLYDDLKNCIKNEDEAINHYLEHGKKENRLYNYSDIFDWMKYINYYDDLKDNIKTKDEAIKHYLDHGKYENRFFFKLKNNIINSTDLSNKIPDIDDKILSQSSNIIISLSTIPTRFLTNIFDNVLESLIIQLIPPKYIVINLCNEYKREFIYDKELFYNKIQSIKNKYNNIIVNFSEDYGPITKILGLINLKNIIDDNDKIIVLDDDWKFKNTLTYHYEIVYSLYNCESIFIDERLMINWNNNMEILDFENIYYDNYQNFAYGWLSFSFKYKYVNMLYDFYNEIIKINDEIIKHDDLIITLFYKKYKLYACGINLFINIYERLSLDNIDALRNDDKTNILRLTLEKNMLNHYNIEYTILRDHIYIVNKKIYDMEYSIQNNIDIRKYLYNIENIKYNQEFNDFQIKHFDIKYFNKNIFIITITNFDNNQINETNYIKLNINNKEYNIINNCYNDYFNKKSFFITTNDFLNKIQHKDYDFNIMQNDNKNNISINKFYSICTILNYIPDIKYIFFNENDRIQYINIHNSTLLNIYNNLNVGAYKSDFFRAYYIYLNGGLYFDCKNILFTNINDILLNKEVYAEDLYDGVCNGFLYCSYKFNKNIKDYICKMIYNINNNLYLDSSLAITGPMLLKNYIKDNILLKNTLPHDNWFNCYFINKSTNKILIKISYHNYYNENNYLKKNHYCVLYNNKLVYKNYISFDKINFIDHILWINLERSNDRRLIMENLFKNINIPNTRINAIDGKNEDVKSYVNTDYERNLSDYEIACTLSHIKAINYLKNINGNYFMICEDDISFNNINLFNETLQDIIKNSPPFDILLLSKIYYYELGELYSNWNYHLDFNGMNYQIAGTGCYIISRSGINKIINNASYNIISNTFNFSSKKIDVADMYIYKNLDAYVYKYDFIGIQCVSSLIHDDHVNHQSVCSINQQNLIIKNLL